MQRLQIYLVIILLLLGAAYYYQERVGLPLSAVVVPGNPVVHVGDTPVRVRVADTPEERAQGLSDTDSIDELGKADGMLFIFDEEKYHGIWMKDMRYHIDVIWVNNDLTVVGITENISPDTYPEIFEPPHPARFAIEVDSFYAETFGIQVGERVDIPAAYLPEDLK